MKPSFLSTKRRNTKKHPLTRSLRAVTSRRKKQRVAATADYGANGGFDDYHEDSGPRIGRVLVIIFLIHIVAIGLIYIHQVYLKNNLPSATAAETSPAAETTSAAPRLSTGDQPYIVERGDNYARIAAAHDVEEADLRRANDNTEIRPGLLLKIPPRRITAAEPPAVAAIRNPAAATTTPSENTQPPANPATAGLIAANDPADRTANAPRATPVGTRTHKIQPGETIWRISQQYNVNQDTLMKLNNITDPRRIQVGQTLKIP